MTRLPVLFMAIVLALLPVTATARAPDLADAWNGAEIAWRDIGAGIKESVKTGKPVIMVFHAPWCSACKKYRAVFKDPSIVEAARDFVMILIDADADKYANGAFSPDGTYVPRTLFLDTDGNVRTEFRSNDPEHPHSVDIDSPDELLALMKKAAKSLSQAAAPVPKPDGI
jgi:protein-disulfide reductase (glutathione)